MLIKRLAVLAILGMWISAAAHAQDIWRGGEFRGSVILTVTGNVSAPTRGVTTEEVDKFFVYSGIAFESASQFDYSRLSTLPQQNIKADFPMGNQDHIHTFTGPLLIDVIRAAGATGETVTLTALDGYAIEVPMVELVEKGAVLSLKRDGIPYGIGDFGPAHLVFPRAERLDLAAMNDDWWIWSIYHIKVE